MQAAAVHRRAEPQQQPLEEEAEATAGLAALFSAGAPDDDPEEGASDFYTEALSLSPTGPTLTLHVTLAADDGAAPASLFAFSVWNGARLLASHLHNHPDLIRGQTTIEFGAAGALPSLAALGLGARFALLTDYPAPPLLEAMRRTLADARNAAVLGLEEAQHSRAAVAGHLWGQDVRPLLAFLPEGTEFFFDVALVGECLWLHREHENLLASIHRCLRPGGQALISFSHHVPGCEEQDLRFFELAQTPRVYDDDDGGGGGGKPGCFEVEKVGAWPMPHAHVQGRTAPQFLYRLVKTQQEQQRES